MAAIEEHPLSQDAGPEDEEEDVLLLKSKSLTPKHAPRRRTVLLVLATVAAVAILLLVCLAAVLAVKLGSASSSVNHDSKFSFNDTFNKGFSPSTFHGEWYQQNDGRDMLTTVTSSGDFVGIFPNDLSNVTIVPGDITEELKAVNFKLSHSFKYVLIQGPTKGVYRHSTLAKYYVFSRDTQSYAAIKVGSATDQLQFCQWNPVSDELVLAVNYSLYYIRDLSTLEAVPLTTGPGERDHLQYGVPDWVYEEEMLSTGHAVWCSPNGSHLTYVVFEDTRVPRYRFPLYGGEEQVYPEIESLAYPKSGQRNPNITVFVEVLSSVEKVAVLPPERLSDDHYMQTGGWLNDTHLYVVWLNRTQTERIFALYDILASQDTGLLPVREFSETVEGGWIETGNNPTVANGNLLQILSQDSGQAGSFAHLAEINLENESRRFLTSGQWEVTSIVGYKEDSSDVLYLSTQSNVWERHVYSTKSGLSDPCLSCAFSTWAADRGVPKDLATLCSVFDTTCSKGLDYCVLTCSGPTVPFSLLVQYRDGQLQEVSVLEDNGELLQLASTRTLPRRKEILVIPGDPGTSEPELYASVLYPPGFDSGKNNHYPVLFSVYGGPSSETIVMSSIFLNKWALFQSASMDCVIVSVDGRGTGFRGDRFKFSVYRHLGEFETEDLIRAGRYLSGLSYVDGSRLAIYGTSYGGYMAGMVGSSGSGVFKVAVSRSPVTDWRYYDSIYTERYMSTPQDNAEGYEKSSVLNRAAMFKDVRLLLIHGTGDDNVHFQNTAQLVKALTDSRVQFRLQVYTDKTHSIAGEFARPHLYTLIDAFLRENL